MLTGLTKEQYLVSLNSVLQTTLIKQYLIKTSFSFAVSYNFSKNYRFLLWKPIAVNFKLL